MKIFDIERIAEQRWLVQALHHDFLCFGTQFGYGYALLIGDVAKQRAVATGDSNKSDASIMLVRPYFRAGEQRRRIDKIVEIIDDDRAALFEKCVPRGRRAGELAGVGDDVAFCSFRAARPKNQYRFTIRDGSV